MQFNDLGRQWSEIRSSVIEKIDSLGFKGSYINGPEVSQFEKDFSDHYGAKYSVGVSNGTDGLKIALQVFDLGEEDLVIIPANTFIADYLAVKHLPGGIPKIALIDHDEYFTIDTSHLESFLKEKRKDFRRIVVIPVHLYGHPCDMDVIMRLASEYNFNVIEDCSQSHESKYNGNHLGSYGDLAVYSLYPGKNLGACGDAGIITTNSEEFYHRMRSIRNYGSKVKYHYDEIGYNNRLDSMQAIVLSEKLRLLEKWTEIKNRITERYQREINNPNVFLPKVSDSCTLHSYHIFCLEVEDRGSFEKFMSEKGIPTIIHYPIPIHRTSIFDSSDIIFSSSNTDKTCNRIVSIPIHPFLSEEEIDLVISSVNSWTIF
jgi:dTDP-4-amino-4,6-dideoxygalactose transaminase